MSTIKSVRTAGLTGLALILFAVLALALHVNVDTALIVAPLIAGLLDAGYRWLRVRWTWLARIDPATATGVVLADEQLVGRLLATPQARALIVQQATRISPTLSAIVQSGIATQADVLAAMPPSSVPATVPPSS